MSGGDESQGDDSIADDGTSKPKADGGFGPDFEESEPGEWDADADEARMSLLRDVANDVRGDTSESQQLAAILYRVSDLYDPDEETTPEEIYRNVRFIMQVKQRGGLGR